ncbi:MAG: hypothetical protein HN392_10160 [Anaerolineae bacterium]|jgi:hypothetical protein|nr:hypothetical protein [Anaerolineae bacterium]
MQGGCFIRFPLLNGEERENVEDEDNKTVFADHRLETLISDSPHFTNCLAKYVFIKPRKNSKELLTLNLDTSRIYPEVENIALRIKQRLFEE